MYGIVSGNAGALFGVGVCVGRKDTEISKMNTAAAKRLLKCRGKLSTTTAGSHADDGVAIPCPEKMSMTATNNQCPRSIQKCVRCGDGGVKRFAHAKCGW